MLQGLLVPNAIRVENEEFSGCIVSEDHLRVETVNLP